MATSGRRMSPHANQDVDDESDEEDQETELLRAAHRGGFSL
jgi:hypothetical protein